MHIYNKYMRAYAGVVNNTVIIMRTNNNNNKNNRNRIGKSSGTLWYNNIFKSM